MRIAIATGTRADWGLLLPLARQLRAMGCDPLVVATHAHFFEELGLTVNEITADGFGPAYSIPTSRRPAEATADATRGFAHFFDEYHPDAVVILGDRFEMLGVATAALLCGVPVVHIAGGNVTEGAYDNAIRNALSQMASLHLPETHSCARRLIEMGCDPSRVVAAGSPGVYNALNETLMTQQELEESLSFPLSSPGEKPDFLIATLHAATLDEESPLQRQRDFLLALGRHLNENPKRRLIITYPNSDTDTAPLIRDIEDFAAERNKLIPRSVMTIPSLGRIRYLSAAALATAVIGNSSSAIEEIPSLGIPTLDIGIRQKGRERGPGVVHCEASSDKIKSGLDYVCSPEAAAIARHRDNPYYIPATPLLQAQAIFSLLENQSLSHNCVS